MTEVWLTKSFLFLGLLLFDIVNLDHAEGQSLCSRQVAQAKQNLSKGLKMDISHVILRQVAVVRVKVKIVERLLISATLFEVLGFCCCILFTICGRDVSNLLRKAGWGFVGFKSLCYHS